MRVAAATAAKNTPAACIQLVILFEEEVSIQITGLFKSSKDPNFLERMLTNLAVRWNFHYTCFCSF